MRRILLLSRSTWAGCCDTIKMIARRGLCRLRSLRVAGSDDEGEEEHALGDIVLDGAVLEQLNEVWFLGHACFEGHDVGVFDCGDWVLADDAVAFALGEVVEELVEVDVGVGGVNWGYG